VAEGRVAEVVRQRDRLAQVFVQAEAACQRARHLRHLQRVRHPRAKQIALVVEEDLRLVDQAPEGRAVDDAVAVALEFVAVRIGRQRVAPPARLVGPARVRRQLVHPLHSATTPATTSSGTARIAARPGASITT
jgi:hypothetical protein